MTSGDNIIIPMAINSEAMTISITKNGKNIRNPISKAVFNSEVIKAGSTMFSGTACSLSNGPDFDKSTNKFTAMDPKDNKLVDDIYNSPDPTAAVKKLVKDTAPPDVNTINKELNKYRRPDDQIKTFDNLDPTTYPSDPKQREKLFEPMLDRLQNKDPKKEAAKKKLKAMDQLNLSDEISKISKEITQMEQMIKLRKEMNNIPKPTINRAKENGLSLEFTKEKLANGKILKDL